MYAVPCLLGLALLSKRKSSPKFLSREETSRAIREDKDHYIKNLTFADLIARGLRSRDDYVRRAGVACADFTPAEKARLTEMAKDVDSKLVSFDRGNLSRIPWAFAKTSNILENGLPYTRGEVIYLPTRVLNDRARLAGTLAHEKAHVYQRLFPRETQTYLKELGYVPVRARESSRASLLRSNPDEDGWMYAKDGKLVGTYYNSPRPQSLLDITGRSHPYEVMARSVEDMFQRAS